MVVVYHWIVQPHAKGSQELIEAMRKISEGDISFTKSVMHALSTWAMKGLVLLPVARVEGDSLVDALRHTFHGEGTWPWNEEVEALGPGPWRSSQVGDVLRVGDSLSIAAHDDFVPLGMASRFAIVESR